MTGATTPAASGPRAGRRAYGRALAALLLLLAPLTARAQDASRGPYVRVFSGLGITRPGDLSIRQPALDLGLTFEQVSWAHQSLSTEWTRDSIPYMGARVGGFPLGVPWLGVSAEVVHFTVRAEADRLVRVTGVVGAAPIDLTVPLDQFVQRYQVGNGVNLILGNIQAHRWIGRGTGTSPPRADLYAGVGAGTTVTHTNSVVNGGSRAQYDLGGFAMQAFAGVAWRLFPRWELSGEYKLSRTTIDGAVDRGTSHSRLYTNHVVLGIGLLLSGRDRPGSAR